MAVDVLRRELDEAVDGLETAIIINGSDNLEGGEYMSNPTVMSVVDRTGELLRDAPDIGLPREEITEYKNKIEGMLGDYS